MTYETLYLYSKSNLTKSRSKIGGSKYINFGGPPAIKQHIRIKYMFIKINFICYVRYKIKLVFNDWTVQISKNTILGDKIGGEQVMPIINYLPSLNMME